jgi:hypothetical protein
MVDSSPLAGPVLPHDLVAGLLGAETDEQFEFAGQVLEALAKVSPGLVPRLSAHPFADAIAEGVSAFPRLLAEVKAQKDELLRAGAVDAIAEIIARDHATVEVVTALGKILEGTRSSAVASVAARALALAGDEGFLMQQRGFLASDQVDDVRLSARLLGYGRHQPSVEALLLCIRPDNMAAAEVVVWALGEIGDPAALTKLHGMLSDLILVEPTIEAVGKIGDPTSVIRLLPFLIEGSTGQREKAAQALGRIARKGGGRYADKDLERATRTALERTLDGDKSTLARFHAIVAYSLLGGSLAPARIKKSLGAKLDARDVDALAGFLSQKGAPRSGATRKKVRRKTV